MCKCKKLIRFDWWNMYLKLLIIAMIKILILMIASKFIWALR